MRPRRNAAEYRYEIWDGNSFDEQASMRPRRNAAEYADVTEDGLDKTDPLQ